MVPATRQRLKWSPLLVAGAVAFASGCSSPTKAIATNVTAISTLTSRAQEGLRAASTAFIRPDDAPPATPEEVAAGQRGIKFAQQAVRDIDISASRIVEALPGVRDNESPWLSTIRMGIYTIALLATLFGLWYLGVGALIGRFVGLVAALIPQIIPRHIDAQAKLDAEALRQVRSAAGTENSPAAVAAADTLSSNVAIRRTRSSLYEAAFNRHFKGAK